MANLTALETRYLNAIVGDDYGAGGGIDDAIDHPVWTWSPAEEFGKSAGGIASSLTKKGFVDGNGVGDKDDTIWLTSAGADALLADNKARREAMDDPCDLNPAQAEEAIAVHTAKKGHHPKHPTCGCCGKAVYKSDTVGKRVKKSDPWGYCRTVGCERSGRFIPVVGTDNRTTTIVSPGE